MIGFQTSNNELVDHEINLGNTKMKQDEGNCDRRVK